MGETCQSLSSRPYGARLMPIRAERGEERPTTLCPVIVAFEASGASPFQWCARYVDGRRFLPMVFDGATKDAVIARAERFWIDETAKSAAIGIQRARTMAHARAARHSDSAARPPHDL